MYCMYKGVGRAGGGGVGGVGGWVGSQRLIKAANRTVWRFHMHVSKKC